jgi:phenylacetic acid degradation operon negative regulatory protein
MAVARRSRPQARAESIERERVPSRISAKRALRAGPAGALAPILAHLRGEPSRTWSIIVTVFGDAILPRGGAVSLSALLTFFRSLDIGDGVVRTAMSRLASDGLIERQKVGRNSYYALAAKGRTMFSEAAARIYADRPPSFAGYLDLVPATTAAEREKLEAAGFAAVAPGLWVAPGGRALAPPGLLRLQASGEPQTLRELAARAWPLAETGAAYARFLAAFAPLADALDAGVAFSDLEAFTARILLVHEYRRIALRDPFLPEALLAPDWPGAAARTLCAAIYARVLDASERWLDAEAPDANGEATKADPAILFARFAPARCVTENP